MDGLLHRDFLDGEAGEKNNATNGAIEFETVLQDGLNRPLIVLVTGNHQASMSPFGEESPPQNGPSWDRAVRGAWPGSSDKGSGRE